MEKFLHLGKTASRWFDMGTLFPAPTAFVRVFDARQFGACRKCIRTAFVAMVASWLLVLSTVTFHFYFLPLIAVFS
jgi:hypothetical protein